MYFSKTQLNYAAYLLKCGEVIAHPTDTIYGLSALADQECAAYQLLKLKKRPLSKGLILLASRIEFVLPYIEKLKPSQINTITKTQQATTYLVNKNKYTPDYICGEFTTVALRITPHPIIGYLCAKTGSALLSSSANISRYTPTKSGVKCRQYFGAGLGTIILPNRPDSEDKPSTIKHLHTQVIYR